ncbi:MAG: ATP-binding cassette domain-containing protein [Armatimonadetes bacterium]|nr:ATP-binding cassette domain-containing protein [Armatimonadota bacterium]
MESGRATLSVSGVSKRFGSLEALKPLSVDFLPGEVHAVVGENGAGKSTLMNVLGGFLSPTTGSVSLGGVELAKGDPKRARAMGIEMVHQHFKLVPAFTIRENLLLSQYGIRQRDIVEIERRAKAFGWEIPWESRVQDVSVGIQQRVEILKCVATQPRVMIFDEPTAVLSEREVAELISFMRGLAREGKVVILIAHKIEEVLSASDRITVLRRGEHIGTLPCSEAEPARLVEMMVGEMMPSSGGLVGASIGGKAFEISGVLDGISLSIGAGQIVGIGGVDGNGQVELAETLAGVRRLTHGSLRFEGESLNFGKTYVGYVPQDRQSDGLAVDLNLMENMAVAGLTNGEKFSATQQAERAVRLIDEFSIKAKSGLDKARQLSGGNQQKVILARVLDQRPRILVVVNPTRGLDVKASAFVHTKLREAAKAGACVVVFTTDRDELFAISDVQWFMSRGRLFASEGEALAS